MARLVTVHLLVAETNNAEPGTRYNEACTLADGISALLGDAEATGFLLDWGYAVDGTPERARSVPEAGYAEGDFYRVTSLASP